MMFNNVMTIAGVNSLLFHFQLACEALARAALVRNYMDNVLSFTVD